MRLANVAGRLAAATDSGFVDVATASDGRFGPDPQQVYAVWDAFVGWAAQAIWPGGIALDESTLGPVVPRPGQIFAVGLNYADHAAESGFRAPAQPMIFTKFSSCLAGPAGDIVLPSGSVDWEVELVAVIGRAASAVAADDAWQYVAGLTIGQDISDRELQMKGAPPQFSLAKSHARFGPIGPYLVTLDEIPQCDDLALSCLVNGEIVQNGRTSDMIFSVPDLVSYLSKVCTLKPGDLIFTGTPSGVGMGRDPVRYLNAGDVLETRIEGIGAMRHRCVAATV